MSGKCIGLLVISLWCITSTYGQKVSLNVPLGYTFDDRVKLDEFTAKVDGAFQWGGSLEFFASPLKSLEVSYQRMDTKMSLYGPGGAQVNQGFEDGSIQYILLGGNTYIDKSGSSNKRPFIGGGLGLGIMQSGDAQSSTNFAFNLKAGVKISTGKALALKLQTYVQAITGAFGTDYWSTGNTVYAVPDRATLFQFGLGGVVCFDFRGK